MYAAEIVLTKEQAESMFPPDQRSTADTLAGTRIRWEEFVDADHLPRRIVDQETGPAET